MPQSELSRPVSGAKRPRFTIYTVMLLISLIALLITCILLWLELSSYGSWPQWRAS